MGKYSKEHLEYTVKVWQEYFPYPITLEKAQEICDNVVGFIKPFIQFEVDTQGCYKNAKKGERF